MGLLTTEQELRAPARARAAAPTLGVEEELLLLDPAAGQVIPAAPELLTRLGGARWAKAELMRFQFEAVTDICTSLDQLRAQLTAHRQTAATLAEGLGCLLVASGIAPQGTPGLTHLTPLPRYRELTRQFPATLVANSGATCGCHVHVGVPSRDLGVQVLNRLRPWLPSLLALAANSPFAGGRDTGWASWRYPLHARWPTARPPPVCASAADYDTVVSDLVRASAALDERSVYFLARLSPRYPTVEVRIADVCLEVEDAVLLAGLVRALVTTAIAEAEGGLPVRSASVRRIEAAALVAARHGLTGPGLDPWSGVTVAQCTLLDRLLDHVQGALARSGDDQEIAALVGRFDQRGTGADRQRTLRASGASPGELATGLACATLASSTHPLDGWQQERPGGDGLIARGSGGSRSGRGGRGSVVGVPGGPTPKTGRLVRWLGSRSPAPIGPGRTGRRPARPNPGSPGAATGAHPSAEGRHRLVWRRSAPVAGAVRCRPSQAGNEDSDDPGEVDAVEGAGAADRHHRVPSARTRRRLRTSAPSRVPSTPATEASAGAAAGVMTRPMPAAMSAGNNAGTAMPRPGMGRVSR
jgi:glutamate---cysteine ligase / carboxylate-amine ligase